MASGETHRGVAAADPRNAGPIEFFRPKPVTRESATARLAPYYARRPAELEARVRALLERIAKGPTAPDPPLSQPLEALADRWLGLGTHPDIIEAMWKLDEDLPERCRWVFWGGPALVHPRTGVVFAVGLGTLGFVVRLAEAARAEAAPDQAFAVFERNPGQPFDISAAGPEWRFIGPRAPKEAWIRAAYDFAAAPA
ncbi:MAG: hypothetical protein JO127_19770 [Caulobacteraceae bacterium]|nr:hypothetical protein [Caulobacteraceae bacterium]